mgnify:CR=1 FL=1
MAVAEKRQQSVCSPCCPFGGRVETPCKFRRREAKTARQQVRAVRSFAFVHAVKALSESLRKFVARAQPLCAECCRRGSLSCCRVMHSQTLFSRSGRGGHDKLASSETPEEGQRQRSVDCGVKKSAIGSVCRKSKHRKRPYLLSRLLGSCRSLGKAEAGQRAPSALFEEGEQSFTFVSQVSGTLCI